jgi:hypothetical protein
VTTPTRGPLEQVHVRGAVPTPKPSAPAKAAPPSAAQVCARVQVALARQRRTMPGPLVRQPAPAARLAAILHNAAMDLWDVATEQDEYQMWEEARAIASRILAACPTA